MDDEDPFTDLKNGYTDMLDNKQTMETIQPKMIDMNSMSKAQIAEVRTKNIINTKPTLNRGPKPGE